MRRQFKTTAAFPEPNYTQIPNDFFKMLPDMEASEVRVTLVMMRQTFGFHRDSFKMGIDELADAAGLSRNAAKDGAEAAEIRGTFRRVNPEKQTKAEWELMVDGQSVMVNECPTNGQPVTIEESTSDPQVGVKESIKETTKEKDLLDGILFFAGQDEALKTAHNDFEASLGFGNLPWGSGVWEKFGKWVQKTYTADPAAFRKYAEWRKKDGKYQAMNNKQIRLNPEMFIDTGYPAFLAYTSMYGKRENDGEFGLL